MVDGGGGSARLIARWGDHRGRQTHSMVAGGGVRQTHSMVAGGGTQHGGRGGPPDS